MKINPHHQPKTNNIHAIKKSERSKLKDELVTLNKDLGYYKDVKVDHK